MSAAIAVPGSGRVLPAVACSTRVRASSRAVAAASSAARPVASWASPARIAVATSAMDTGPSWPCTDRPWPNIETPAGRSTRSDQRTQRTLLIILVGVLTGVATGLLMTRAGHSPHEAVLTGIAAFAAAMKFVDWLIT